MWKWVKPKCLLRIKAWGEKGFGWTARSIGKNGPYADDELICISPAQPYRTKGMAERAGRLAMSGWRVTKGD